MFVNICSNVVYLILITSNFNGISISQTISFNNSSDNQTDYITVVDNSTDNYNLTTLVVDLGSTGPEYLNRTSTLLTVIESETNLNQKNRSKPTQFQTRIRSSVWPLILTSICALLSIIATILFLILNYKDSQLEESQKRDIKAIRKKRSKIKLNINKSKPLAKTETNNQKVDQSDNVSVRSE